MPFPLEVAETAIPNEEYGNGRLGASRTLVRLGVTGTVTVVFQVYENPSHVRVGQGAAAIRVPQSSVKKTWLPRY